VVGNEGVAGGSRIEESVLPIYRARRHAENALISLIWRSLINYQPADQIVVFHYRLSSRVASVDVVVADLYSRPRSSVPSAEPPRESSAFQLLIASRLINLAISGRDASAQRSPPYLLLLAPVFFLVRLLLRLANSVTFLSPRGGTSLCPSPLEFPANERDRTRSRLRQSRRSISSSLCYSLVFPRDFWHLSRIIST